MKRKGGKINKLINTKKSIEKELLANVTYKFILLDGSI